MTTLQVVAIAAVLLLPGCSEDTATGTADASPSITDAAPVLTWTSFGADFMNTYCGDCHGAGDSLRDYTVLAMIQAEQANIRCGVSPTALSNCSIAAGMFPIGSGAKPTESERLDLVRWIDEGALE